MTHISGYLIFYYYFEVLLLNLEELGSEATALHDWIANFQLNV